MAVITTILIRVIADGSRSEHACIRIAAGISRTTLRSTTIAVLARFDDSIAALLLGNDGDATVVDETLSIDGVAGETAADVADGARGEVIDAVGGGGVHDVLATGITAARAELAALLGLDEGGVLA